MQNDERPSYAIESVDNALRLLLILRHAAPLTVSAAAAELGVARSTAHRLLAMLKYRGFAEQSGDRTYRLGPALHDARAAARPDRDVREAARPHLEALNQRVGETVHLMVRVGTDVRFLDSVEATHALRVSSRAGAVMPAHRTSGGKALLAELSRDALAALYEDGLPTELPFAADDIAGYHRALSSIRTVGYGLNNGESEPGITALGCCVRDANGRAVAAIALSAPTLRFPRGRIPEIETAVKKVAAQVSEQLRD
ncbi:IclR family transcriptional regulator [Streptomyces sp. NPDC090442]|uniref:IclR family transcriptional regulator n=1 Tax=Streptomyces sp. NPDC090442 TaxID=3365962 RepID=UPI003812ADC9